MNVFFAIVPPLAGLASLPASAAARLLWLAMMDRTGWHSRDMSLWHFMKTIGAERGLFQGMAIGVEMKLNSVSVSDFMMKSTRCIVRRSSSPTSPCNST